jgi:hypothetical protein
VQCMLSNAAVVAGEAPSSPGSRQNHFFASYVDLPTSRSMFFSLCTLMCSAVAQLDGATVASVNSSQITSGVVGLLAEGSASGWFDNVVATTDCDGGFQCLGMCDWCTLGPHARVDLCCSSLDFSRPFRRQAPWWEQFARLVAHRVMLKPVGMLPGHAMTAVCGLGRRWCATCCRP